MYMCVCVCVCVCVSCFDGWGAGRNGAGGHMGFVLVGMGCGCCAMALLHGMQLRECFHRQHGRDICKSATHGTPYHTHPPNRQAGLASSRHKQTVAPLLSQNGRDGGRRAPG